MTASLPDVRGLLTGAHATRVKGAAAASSIIRTVEGGHGRRSRGPAPDEVLRFVRLASIELAVRSHHGRDQVSTQRSPTRGDVLQFNLAGKAIVPIDGRRTPMSEGQAFPISPALRPTPPANSPLRRRTR